MNKKIKYRILGILVIVGLAIIILPLFQITDAPTNSSVVKAPPFPEPEVNKINQNIIDIAPPVVQEKQEKLNEFEDEPTHDEIKTKPTPNPFPEKAIANKAEPNNKPIIKIKTFSPTTLAWAVQLGSFKNKDNAIRLVNQLRKSGYQAFLRHIPASFGESIRVYVGPEPKRDAARQLALELEKGFHIKGIIVHYQPLAL